MAQPNKITRPHAQILDKPWLKGTNLYFVEYLLFLVLLTAVLWTFDTLVFSIFSYIADGATSLVTRLRGIPAVASVVVLIPALVFFWRRVRNEEQARPQVWLRKAHRFPLYAFVLLQILSVIIGAYLIALGLVGAIVSGFGTLGETLLETVLPGLFMIVVHLIASMVFLGRTPRQERSFVLGLSAAMLIAAFILMLVMAINSNKVRTQNTIPRFNDDSSLFDSTPQDNTLRGRNFFDY